MRITQWGEYATHFCIYLAQNEALGKKSHTAHDIARAQEIDPLYAQQILQRLRKSNIVESIRGPQGGYKLARSPFEITLKDILAAAEGDTFEVLCESKPLDSARCAPDTACSLRGIWHELKDHVNIFLESKSLQSLAFEQYEAQLVTSIGKN